jgi:hypothetical protein
MTVGYSCVVFG